MRSNQRWFTHFLGTCIALKITKKSTLTAPPVITIGCGWNYDRNDFDYHAGGEYDELSIWTRQLINNASMNELPFMMGGYCKYISKE